jgi:hypothetical protein
VPAQPPRGPGDHPHPGPELSDLKGINPIEATEGVTVWGENVIPPSPSALEAVGVRQLLADIQSAISKALTHSLLTSDFRYENSSLSISGTQAKDSYEVSIKLKSSVKDIKVSLEDLINE